jgi:hypothetical protein
MTSLCGPAYDGGASVALGVTALDRSTPSDGGIGVQLANRSAALGAPVVPYFTSRSSDPDAAAGLVAVLAAEAGAVPFSDDDLSPAPAAVIAGIDLRDPAGTGFGVVVQRADGGGANLGPYPAGDLFSLPLMVIDGLSVWAESTLQAPTGFLPGQSYVFVLVGNPAEEPFFVPLDGGDGGAPSSVPNFKYDGRGLHLLAFPASFASKRFGQ